MANLEQNTYPEEIQMSPVDKVYINSTILRAYDIRGTYGVNLTNDTATWLGHVFGQFLVQKNYSSIVVGYDGRLSSPALKEYLIQALSHLPLKILDIGVVATPQVYFAIQKLQADAGIMITGSHNPPEDNGFKISLKDRPFFGQDIQNLLSCKMLEKAEVHPEAHIECIRTSDDYFDTLLKDLRFEHKKLNFAIDCGNGATGPMMTRLVDTLKNQYHHNIDLLFADIDGHFPNHSPDPSIIDNLSYLCEHVVKNKLDFGLALDGDGDRLVVIKSDGTMIPGDQLSYIFAQSIVSSHACSSRRTTIMADVKTSQIFFDELEKDGVQTIMLPTGHSYFKEAIKKHHADFGGEMSGHFFFNDRYAGYDDGIYALLRFVELATHSYDFEKQLEPFQNVYTSFEIKVNCGEEIKFFVMERIKEIIEKHGYILNTLDGIRCVMDHGWFLIRPSNTSAYIIGRIEAKDPTSFEKLNTFIQNTIQRAMK